VARGSLAAAREAATVRDVPEPRPFVIAVGGIPGAGKTTLARRLAEMLHVPVLVRDEIKEGMHVTVGSDDPADVRRFAEAAFTAFWSVAADLVAAGVSLVMEAAFHREFAGAGFERLAHAGDVQLLWCTVDPEIALARYRARAPLRHPAHADALQSERMAHPAFDRSVYDPPPGPWPLVRVDTGGSETSPPARDLCRILMEQIGRI
jgi:predicted kinase